VKIDALGVVNFCAIRSLLLVPQKWSFAMISSDHDISVLNGLIKTTLDSMKGYEDAAEDAKNTEYANSFAEFARDRGAVASAMQAEVRRVGGNPEDGSSFLAAAHRTFMDLKQSLTGKDDKAIVLEVERGEDFIKGKFQAALKDDKLSASTLEVIQIGYQSVRAGHDRASALKHSLS
jgi:uncharacterized protein (TIGR02284 family)